MVTSATVLLNLFVATDYGEGLGDLIYVQRWADKSQEVAAVIFHFQLFSHDL